MGLRDIKDAALPPEKWSKRSLPNTDNVDTTRLTFAQSAYLKVGPGPMRIMWGFLAFGIFTIWATIIYTLVLFMGLSVVSKLGLSVSLQMPPGLMDSPDIFAFFWVAPVIFFILILSYATWAVIKWTFGRTRDFVMRLKVRMVLDPLHGVDGVDTTLPPSPKEKKYRRGTKNTADMGTEENTDTDNNKSAETTTPHTTPKPGATPHKKRSRRQRKNTNKNN